MTSDDRRILSVSVTESGRRLCGLLPFDHVHGKLAEAVRSHWTTCDGFVLAIAVGAAVRIIGPLLGEKAEDPAVVCVDDLGRHVVAVLGGHGPGANDLAGEIAALLGAEPVITTASDVRGVPALDVLPGLRAEGALAAVMATMLDGRRPDLENPLGWPIPHTLEERCSQGAPDPARSSRIVVTDAAVPRADDAELPTVFLRPPSLVAGIGCSTGAPPEEIDATLQVALARGGLSRASVATVATIDRRANEPAVLAIGLPIATFAAAALATVPVPTPSSVVEAAVGTPSVSEAAALLAAGPGATLLVTKQVSPHATVAIARRRQPHGHLALVGLGPGGREHRTPAAVTALRRADTVIGYHPYVSQCADVLTPAQEVSGSPIGAEVERAKEAVRWAASGRSVAMVCSGDAGIYAMASIVIEEAGETPGFEIEVVPGVTAALASAALLGAPLGHDHMVLSLSDLLTPWDDIVRRVEAARDADLVIALYNPRSKQRDWQLAEVRDLLLATRAPDTPVGIVSDAGRPNETASITSLAELDPELVGMTTCVIIGSSSTRVVGKWMVTPRGYRRSS